MKEKIDKILQKIKEDLSQNPLVVKVKGLLNKKSSNKKKTATKEDPLDAIEKNEAIEERVIKESSPSPAQGQSPKRIIVIVIIVGAVLFLFYDEFTKKPEDDILDSYEDAPTEEAIQAPKKMAPTIVKKAAPSQNPASPEMKKETPTATPKPEEPTVLEEEMPTEAIKEEVSAKTQTSTTTPEPPPPAPVSSPEPEVELPPPPPPVEQTADEPTEEKDIEEQNKVEELPSPDKPTAEMAKGEILSEEKIDDKMEKQVTKDKEKIVSKKIDEKLTKQEDKKEIKKEDQAHSFDLPLLSYVNSGRGLVYNCHEKHWACVDKENFFLCKKYEELSMTKKVNPPCIPWNVYYSKRDCQRAQQKKIHEVELEKKCQSFK